VHPRAPYFFITNEREPSVSSFQLDSGSGEVRHVQTIATIPDGGTAGQRVSPADIRLHPNGKFLYSSNRAGMNDSVAIFAVDESTGRLNRVDVVRTGGSGQRELNIEPAGRFLFACNTGSNDVIAFAIDANTGRLTPAAKTTVQRPMVIDFATL
jgi:6-phosphogluconolactonase